MNSHAKSQPRILASEAISWPQAFAILDKSLKTCPEEVALWASQGHLNAYSPDLRNGYHLEAVIPFFDEPDTTPAHDLLAGFRFEKRQIQNFVPAAFMCEAGAVASFSFVALNDLALGTAYYNPSGRFISFIDAVKFLLALKPLAPKNPDEIESRIACEVKSGRIAPRHYFGHPLSERRSLSTAWFTEGAILMLAKQYWDAELTGWDAMSREFAMEELTDDENTAPRQAAPKEIDARGSRTFSADRKETSGRNPRTLEVTVNVRGQQIIVMDQDGEQRVYSRKQVTGGGTKTWNLLALFAKYYGDLQGKNIPNATKLNSSGNRRHLREKLVESLNLCKSPFVKGNANIVLFKRIKASDDGIDAMERQSVRWVDNKNKTSREEDDVSEPANLDDAATDFLRCHGEDMPPIK